MHVAKVVSRQGGREYVSYLLRQTYREDGKVKNRTLANLSALPESAIDAIRRTLAGETLVPNAEDFTLQRSLPHGHVAAIFGSARKLGLDRLLDAKPSRERDLVLAMIVARIVAPASKLATTRLLGTTTLGSLLNVEEAKDAELYAALDWLLERQEAIEGRLLRRHLGQEKVVLYDLTSTYMEGECCPLTKRGYSRDGKPTKAQIEFGLLTTKDGIPLALEAYAGNTGDPTTFADQVEKLKKRFPDQSVIWVADRGMLTNAQVVKLQEIKGAQWVTALRSPAIKRLVEEGTIQPSLFDERNLAEIADARFPGERLVVCYNPLLADERARKREELLVATEAELAKVAAMVERGAAGGRAGLKGAAAIGERVGRVVNKYKMAKHFVRTIGEDSFSYHRDETAITAEGALDGIYVLRTNVTAERLETPDVVLAYKQLAHVERAFRHFKLSDLEVRPIFHHLEPRVRAHLLLCMLAYWLVHHLQAALAPLLFVDEAPPARPDPVAKAPRSDAAKRKDCSKETTDKLPVQSFRTLLANLATLARASFIPAGADARAQFFKLSQPTKLHDRAFALLGLPLPTK